MILIVTRSAARSAVVVIVLLCASLSGNALLAQAPEGPLPPRPGTQIQATPPEVLAKLTARVTLVNTPVTVRDSKGVMIHDLDEQDFRVTDNGVPQKITHFEVGGDPISLVILAETSSRVEPFLPQLRKTGILFTEQVMGPESEAAVIGFDNGLKTLQGFTRSHDAIQSAFAALNTGESDLHLFDAMAAGVEMLSGRRKPTKETPAPGRRVLLLKLSIPAANHVLEKCSAARNSKTSRFSALASPPRARSCKPSRVRMRQFPLRRPVLSACPDLQAQRLLPAAAPAAISTLLRSRKCLLNTQKVPQRSTLSKSGQPPPAVLTIPPLEAAASKALSTKSAENSTLNTCSRIRPLHAPTTARTSAITRFPFRWYRTKPTVRKSPPVPVTTSLRRALESVTTQVATARISRYDFESFYAIR